mmetsp:Transcript_35733/g.75231  ORF Transcript_35733/g.75231 Transcript_35733/m.75231 type:complete len:699 (+) Transcript_35733:149-2245(+)
MPKKNFSDEMSTFSEGRSSSRNIFSSRSKSLTRNNHSTSRHQSSRNNGGLSSSQSVTSMPNDSATTSRGKGMGIFGKFGRSSRRRRLSASNNPDDVSVSASLCSDVLRVETSDCASHMSKSFTGRSNASTTGEAVGRRASVGTMVTTGESLSGGSHSASAESKSLPILPGGVADFNLSRNSLNFLDDSSMTMSHPIWEHSTQREQRKERVKEKLNKYKRDKKELKNSCAALEEQLAHTTEKLKEVDLKASSRIESLEMELRESRGGLERVVEQSTQAVTDQGRVIKGLGKKLIRQAHVIKRQKAAIDVYKVKMEELQEEMALQDERDSKRADEYCQLKDRYDTLLEQKVHMQNMLHENIEDMMDLKIETERQSKSKMELKHNFEQKEAALDGLTKEASDMTNRVRMLELELEKKNMEVEDLSAKLKLSEALKGATMKELDSVNEDVEELQAKCIALENSNGGEVSGRRSVLRSLKKETGGDSTTPTLAQTGRSSSRLRWNRAKESMPDDETGELELQSKNAIIQTLDETVTEREETIHTLKSEIVNISSTFKHESIQKRKEIAKLKQTNAEYALKLRALEKAFKPGGSDSPLTNSTIHGASPVTERMHTSALNGETSLSRHGKSMHSVGSGSPDSLSSKEDKAAAVKARLGLAPHKSPSSGDQQLGQKESQIVLDLNFFEGSEAGSEEERKGEFPEEC